MASISNPSGLGAASRQKAEEAGSVLWISLLFILVGLLAFLFLYIVVNTNERFNTAFNPAPVEAVDEVPELDLSDFEAADATMIETLNAIQARLQSIERGLTSSDEVSRDWGQVILTFLTEFGIFVPLMFILVGIYCIRMGIKLFQRNLITALWARQLMLWMIVAAVVGIFYGFQSSSRMAGGLIIGIFPWAFLLVVSYFIMKWLGSHEHLFYGAESITSRQARTAWNLLIPTLAILVFIALRPLEQTFISSLTNRVTASAVEPDFVGLDNYTRLLGLRIDTYPCADDSSVRGCLSGGNLQSPRRYFIDTVENYREWRYEPIWELPVFNLVMSARDPRFLNSIYNTLFFTVTSVSLELVLGLFIAMVVNSKFPGRGMMRTAMLVPWAIPTAVSARLWEVILRPNQSGIMNVFLDSVGLANEPIAWLTEPASQVWSMVLVDVWKTTPFMALLILAGLQTISSEIYEAADVDGASKIRQFFNITLPLLRPTIAVALVFRTLDAIRVFDVFEVLLSGSTKFSMATYNFNRLVEAQEFGYASAVGVVIFGIILIFTVTYVRVLGVNTR